MKKESKIAFINASNPIQVLFKNEQLDKEIVEKIEVYGSFLEQNNQRTLKSLSNITFFNNYHSFYKELLENSEAYTHLITSCTPMSFLDTLDVESISKETLNFFIKHILLLLPEKFSQSDISIILTIYIFSFINLFEIRKLNLNLKFIIYSGYTSKNEPDELFDFCIKSAIWEYKYIPKTLNHKEDMLKILDFINNK